MKYYIEEVFNSIKDINKVIVINLHCKLVPKLNCGQCIGFKELGKTLIFGLTADTTNRHSLDLFERSQGPVNNLLEQEEQPVNKFFFF